MGNLNYYLLKLLTLPIILISLTVHEISHGYMAYKLGDPTAKLTGRLSLNPLRHLDPIGALCMLFFGFGWARPVPIDVRYFKKPKRDMALTALAGPISNLLLGFITLFLFIVFENVFAPLEMSEFGTKVATVFLLFLYQFFRLNISLAVFNLIPLPPLDGSRIFLIFLPEKTYFSIMKYERYIALALLVLLYTGLLDTYLQFVVNAIVNGMAYVIYLIPFLN